MRYSLENSALHVEIDTHGAEIKSIRDLAEDREYMWQADPAYWGRTSPVLFPFVGSLKNKEFIYEGRHYPMGQHGFARDMEFALESQSDRSVWFALRANDDTRARYPFDFVLRIGYELSERTVTVLWEVQNPGKSDLHFSIGAHPAFLCPIHGEADKSGYRLYFGEEVDEIHHHGNDVASGMAFREDITLALTNHRAVITPDFFDRCTYMIEGGQTNTVGLEDTDGSRIVTLHFDTPLFAIWSPEGKNAPFLCIEPWYGRCDAEDFDGTLEEREYSNRLAPDGVFQASYSMSF